jgi:hypothetical protein
MSTKNSKANCIGQYPALFRFLYSYDSHEARFIPGTGDSENTGRILTVEGQYDVVAPNEGFAIEAFKQHRPASVFALREGPIFVCYVDAEVRL